MGPPSQETERFRGSKLHFEAIFLGNFPNEKLGIGAKILQQRLTTVY